MTLRTSPPTAVIVGNGSSVDSFPPAFWRRCQQPDVMLVGTNRVLCFQSLQDVLWDALVIRDTYRSLWADPLVGWRYHQELWKPQACWKVGPADRRTVHCDEYVRQVAGWQLRRVEDANGEAAVMRNCSVALMAANWAWLRGARRLYLVGVDYRGGHARMIAPYDAAAAGNEWRYQRAVPACTHRQFAEAVGAVEAAGAVLWNLSPGTRLRAVPTIRWQAAIRTGGTGSAGLGAG